MSFDTAWAADLLCESREAALDLLISQVWVNTAGKRKEPSCIEGQHLLSAVLGPSWRWGGPVAALKGG